MENLRKVQSLIRKKAKTNNLSFKASLKEKKDLGYTFEIGNGQLNGRFEQVYGAIKAAFVINKNEEPTTLVKLAIEYLTEVTIQNGYPLLILNRDVEDIEVMRNFGFLKNDLKLFESIIHGHSYYIDYSNGVYPKILSELKLSLENLSTSNPLFTFNREEKQVNLNTEIDNSGVSLETFKYVYVNHEGYLKLQMRSNDYYLIDDQNHEFLIDEHTNLSNILTSMLKENAEEAKFSSLLNPTFYFFEKNVIEHKVIAKLVTDYLIKEGYSREEIETEAAKGKFARNLYWGVQDWNVDPKHKLTMDYTYYYGIMYLFNKYFVFKKEKDDFEMFEHSLDDALKNYRETRQKSKYDTSKRDSFFTVDEGIKVFLEKLENLKQTIQDN